MSNEFDQYASLGRSGKRAFHARRSGQSTKNRGLAKIGYRDPIEPGFHEGPGPLVGRSESEAVSNIKDPSESLAVSNIPSHMPKGASLSPCGDVGELGQTEAVTVFPALRKMGSRIIKASQEIPLKKGFSK
jgi:hypothetical protein